MPSQRTVAWKAEGSGGHQRPRLDMRGVRKDRQVQEGHRHEGDVRHDQRADDQPALIRREAGAEGEWRTGMARPLGVKTRGTAAASMKCQSWTGRGAANGSRPEV
jgi:hypothetical protein